MSTDTAVTAIPSGTSLSAPNSAPNSPPNDRLKFFCSHGGKIVPRPSDGQLKYAGGETRVISVPRDISFRELMKKLTYSIDGEMILKYQLMSEDLDALVSVKCDEDVHLMFDEMDHYKSAGGSRLRVFLFPLTLVVMEYPSGFMEHYPPEQQRYIDSINGIIRPNPLPKHRTTLNTLQCGSLVSSACTSPTSPDSTTTESINGESMLMSSHKKGGLGMHRVRSSPSMCSLNSSQQSNHHIQQFHPQYYQNCRQTPPHFIGYQSLKPPIDSHKSGVPERILSNGSTRVEKGRLHVDVGPQHQYYGFKQNRGNGCCTRWMPYAESGHSSDRRMMDGSRSLTVSPILLSPPNQPSGVRAWNGMIGG